MDVPWFKIICQECILSMPFVGGGSSVRVPYESLKDGDVVVLYVIKLNRFAIFLSAFVFLGVVFDRVTFLVTVERAQLCEFSRYWYNFCFVCELGGVAYENIWY